MSADLRTLAAEAIRSACPSDEQCLADEHACFRAHPIHLGAQRDGVIVEVWASPEGLADAVLAAVLPAISRVLLAKRDQLDADAPRGHDGRAVGLEEAADLVRSLAAAAPPAGLSATVPAEDAPAVPEEADGQRAGQSDALTYAEMESERDRLAGELYEAQMMIERLTVDDDARDGMRRTWLELEHWRTVIVPELMEQRDRLGTDRDRLAAQVAEYRRVVEAAKAWRAMRLGTPTQPKPESSALIAAVDALPDAGTDQTEDDHG
jgi:hypothetical protein